ncbi:uncharacterized protein LOC116158996 [Photinus pyralis]|uniref:uncharacterized protein LOC116158996 n=2 Tax=Photinus pyralis TaxID=7054 RepID=UPI001267219B|nr:uncharacterized protein LOC116158996 [Photinus pyralis]
MISFRVTLRMNSNKEKLAALIIIYKKKREMAKVGKKCWVKPWIERRAKHGACSTLIAELHIEDAQQFRNFVRMSAVQVQFLINLIGPQIVKQDTIMRSAIPVYERVMVTLRFLATGDSYSSLQYLFRIPVCTIGRIVKEVTVAIYEMLKESYLKTVESSTNN